MIKYIKELLKKKLFYRVDLPSAGGWECINIVVGEETDSYFIQVTGIGLNGGQMLTYEKYKKNR
jgi:hypothetical protein